MCVRGGAIRLTDKYSVWYVVSSIRYLKKNTGWHNQEHLLQMAVREEEVVKFTLVHFICMAISPHERELAGNKTSS